MSDEPNWSRERKVGPHWDDAKFPATPDNINSASTRYRYDFDELAIEIDADARYDQEVIGLMEQLSHAWKEGSSIRPHIHWLQNAVGNPNWLMQYRKYNNGETPPAWINLIGQTPVFTYVSGTILQITPFPTIDMSAMTISGFIDIKISRDTANGSGEFAGADPVATAVLYKEFDIHEQFDGVGSLEEFSK